MHSPLMVRVENQLKEQCLDKTAAPKVDRAKGIQLEISRAVEMVTGRYVDPLRDV